MSREIMFRAWEGKKMITKLKMVVTVGLDNCPLMQFTGLQDSKGVDIYESDVLSPSNRVVAFGEYFGPFGMGTGFYTVAHSSDYDGKPYGLTSRQISESEVIGNIHQNPELLIKGD